jgi:hypothetical protein
MITCRQCGHKYLSIWREHYPGGATTGVTILVHGILLLLIGLLLGVMAFLLSVGILYVLAVVLLLMGLLKIASIRDNRQVLIMHGGNKCPECDTPNDLRWYD